MNHLLDTNFVIGLLRGAVSHWNYLNELLERTLPSLSAITHAEIFAGCHPVEEGATRELLDSFLTSPIDVAIADLAGRYVYQFARRGVTVHLEDALIGATTVRDGLVLVTANVRHFPMLSIGRNLIQFPSV